MRIFNEFNPDEFWPKGGWKSCECLFMQDLFEFLEGVKIGPSKNEDDLVCASAYWDDLVGHLYIKGSGIKLWGNAKHAESGEVLRHFLCNIPWSIMFEKTDDSLRFANDADNFKENVLNAIRAQEFESQAKAEQMKADLLRINSELTLASFVKRHLVASQDT